MSLPSVICFSQVLFVLKFFAELILIMVISAFISKIIGLDKAYRQDENDEEKNHHNHLFL
jgi:hypothetical protein